jgi:hypothetical protein
VCESVFSAMTFIKNKYRSRLTNENLSINMKLATTSYIPRYENCQGQKMTLDAKVKNSTIVINDNSNS